MGFVRIELKLLVNVGDTALLPIRMATRHEALKTADIIYVERRF